MKKIKTPPHWLRSMVTVIRSVLSILLLCAAAMMRPALAAESAGVILAYTGKVEIMHGAEQRAAVSRAELYSGDTIVTGEGQVQIRFADGALLTLYRDTRFAVDDYHYSKGNGDRAQFSLLNGLMHTLTGNMDKRNYQLKTRLANLGVRGTEYSAQLGDVLHVSVDQGRVELANAGGTIQVGAGGSAIVTGADVMPKPATGGKIDLRGHGPGGGKQGGPGPGPGAGPGPGSGAQQGGTHPPPPAPPGTQNFSRQPGSTQPPPEGQQPPPGGQQPPPEGQQPPPGGQQQPAVGQQPPPGGQQPPPGGQQPPPGNPPPPGP